MRLLSLRVRRALCDFTQILYLPRRKMIITSSGSTSRTQTLRKPIDVNRQAPT